MDKHFLIAMTLLLSLQFSKLYAQQWVFLEAGERIQQGVSVTEDRFLYERLKQVNSYSEEVKGSTLFLKLPAEEDFADRVLFMPNDFLLFIFKKSGSEKVHWVAVKVLSSYWKEVFREIHPSPPSILFYTPPGRSLTNQESNALTIIVDRLKRIYCPIDDEAREELAEIMTDFFGESEMRDQANYVMNDYFNRLEEYEKKKQRVEEIRESIQENRAQGDQLIVIHDWEKGKIFLADQYTGVVAYQVNILNSLIINACEKLLYEKQGLDVGFRVLEGINQNIYASDMRLGRVEIAPVTNITLSSAVLDHYEIENPLSKDLKKPDEPTLSEVAFSVTEFKNDYYIKKLESCPENLKKGLFSFGEKKEDINTYLIDGPYATGPQDWIMLTGGKCFKCGGWKESWKTELYIPSTQRSLRIKRTTDFGLLTSPEPSEKRDSILSNIYRAYELAGQGKVKDNELKYLGREGFTYDTPRGKWVLDFKGQEVIFNPEGKVIDEEGFVRWHELFARASSAEWEQSAKDKSIVKVLFEIIAEGKGFWRQYFRQNPLAFLAQYCTVKRK